MFPCFFQVRKFGGLTLGPVNRLSPIWTDLCIVDIDRRFRSRSEHPPLSSLTVTCVLCEVKWMVAEGHEGGFGGGFSRPRGGRCSNTEQ